MPARRGTRAAALVAVAVGAAGLGLTAAPAMAADPISIAVIAPVAAPVTPDGAVEPAALTSLTARLAALAPLPVTVAADPRILDVVAAGEVDYVAMHWRAHADRMRDFTDYSPDGVVETVRRELSERLDAAVAAGIAVERVVLDPGLGFAKEPRHNWELLTRLDVLAGLGRPLLVGASRKSFLGTLLRRDGEPRPVGEREHAHAALVALLADRGVDVLRVHDVRATRDALAVAAAMRGPS